MSTTPTVPTTTTTTPPWAWVIHHLAALLITGALVIASVYGVETLIAKHAAAQAAQDNAALAAVVQTVKQSQTEATARDQALEATVQTLIAQNAALTKTIEQQSQQTQKQVQNDQSLDAQDAASRLSAQTNAATGEVAVSGSNVVLDLPITRRVVADLDTLVGAQADLKSTQTQLANETQVANTAQADATAQKTLVTAQQNQLAAAGKACDAQIASVKASARKGKLKAFGGGVATVLLFLLGHAL
jgi:hypothetical protein